VPAVRLIGIVRRSLPLQASERLPIVSGAQLAALGKLGWVAMRRVPVTARVVESTIFTAR
jgi:hypothetical protein